MKIIDLILIGLFFTTPTYGAKKSVGKLLANNNKAPTKDSSYNKLETKKKNPENTSNITKDLNIDPGYEYEFFGNFKYNISNGYIQRTNETKEKFKETAIIIDSLFGYLMDDSVEPVLDLRYSSNTKGIGDFTSTDSMWNIGLGVLFNIPQAQHITGDNKRINPLMSRAKFIPFGGFLFSYNKTKNTTGVNSDITTADSNVKTQLLGGLRYMIYSNISLNVSMKAYYQESTSTVMDGGEMGGGFKKLSIETSFLSMSLFF